MKNFKKSCVRAITLVMLVCLLAALAGTAFAEGPGATAVVKVSQVFQAQDGYEPSAGTEFKYRFSSLDAANPMPAGVSGALEFKLDGNAARDISLAFDRVGIYSYKVEQLVEKRYENYCYDETVYQVDVYVENDGDGLKATVVALNANGDKCASIEYKNLYWIKYNPKTGDESDLMLWAGLLAASALAAAVVVTLVARKRKKEH